MRGLQKLREAHVLLEIFIVSNFAFLSVDIYVAHSINRFRHWAEWIPFWFSLAATVALAPALVRTLVRDAEWRPSRTGTVVGASAIMVGVLGMFWHLDSHFFAEQTLHLPRVHGSRRLSLRLSSRGSHPTFPRL